MTKKKTTKTQKESFRRPKDYPKCSSCKHKHPYCFQKVEGQKFLFGTIPWFGKQEDVIARGIGRQCTMCECNKEQEIRYYQREEFS